MFILANDKSHPHDAVIYNLNKVSRIRCSIKPIISSPEEYWSIELEYEDKRSDVLLSGFGLADFEQAKGKLMSILGYNASYIA